MTSAVRTFCTLLVCAALAIAIANMACDDTIAELDQSDEGKGAT